MNSRDTLGRGGWLSGNELVPFPFEDGQVLAHPEGGAYAVEWQEALERAFVDASVSVDGPSGSVQAEHPALSGFSVFDGCLCFELVYKTFVTPVKVPSDASSRFPSLSGQAEHGGYVFTFSSERLREFVSLWGSGLPPKAPDGSRSSPQSGLRLCARCLSCSSRKVDSIRVFDGVKPKDEGPHFVVSGDVKLRPGNNMLITGQDANITLNARPGAGMGVIPCNCSGDTGTFMPLASSTGHVRLFNDTCYDLEPVIVTKASGKRVGEVRIHAKCTACCTCQMYASIVNDRLAPLFDTVKRCKQDLGDMLEEYEDGVSRFNKRISTPSASDVQMSLAGVPTGVNLGPRLAGTGISGKMNRCAFTATVRNSSFFELRLKAVRLSASDSVVMASAAWSDKDGAPLSKSANSGAELIGLSFDIQPGRSLVVSLVTLRDEMVGEAVSKSGKFSCEMAFDQSFKLNDGNYMDIGTIVKSIEV